MPNRYADNGQDWWSQNDPGLATGGMQPQSAGTAAPMTGTPNPYPPSGPADAQGWQTGQTPPLSQMPSLQQYMTQNPSYAQNANPTDPAYIRAQLLNFYQQQGMQPTGPGSGPTDIAYYAQKIAETGGWTPQNASYWQGRIPQDVQRASGGGGSAMGGVGSYSGPGAIPPPFHSPTLEEFQQEPGLQARLQMGLQGLQRSAAAQGSILSGGTQQAINRYSQNFASNEYNNSYNRAYQNYMGNYQTQTFDPQNRYLQLYGIGANAAQSTKTNTPVVGS